MTSRTSSKINREVIQERKRTHYVVLLANTEKILEKNTVSNKQLKKAQDEQILKPEILLLESFFFLNKNKTPSQMLCSWHHTIFQAPWPPPPVRARCVQPRWLPGSHANRSTSKRHLQVAGDLCDSHHDCAFSPGIPWHTKSRMSVPEHFLPVKSRFVFFVKQRKAWN